MAFKGVSLEGGISLKHAEAIDNWNKDANEGKFRVSPDSQAVNDWTAIDMEMLEQFAFLSHLDAKGFRYYIPAFMISLLNSYDSASMRVISTLSSLYPKKDIHWNHHMNQYSLLTSEQCRCISLYLHYLPSTIELDAADQKIVHRALKNYWQKFLPENINLD